MTRKYQISYKASMDHATDDFAETHTGAAFQFEAKDFADAWVKGARWIEETLKDSNLPLAHLRAKLEQLGPQD